MPQYLLQLGNTPELSLVELSALVPDVSPVRINDSIVQLKLSDDEHANTIIEMSGGLVKAARVVATIEQAITPEELETKLVDYLLELKLPKLKFGVAEIGRDHLEPLSLSAIKDRLEEYGLKVRYLEGPRTGLSASVLSHQSMAELVVVTTAEQTVIAQTVSVQNIDAWTLRDRGKPYADRRKGMLPPKVARMMVNCALGAPDTRGTVYDPFCGSGTVLIEAAVRGCRVIGSDLDNEAIAGTRRNMEWAQQQLELAPALVGPIFTSDVSQVTPDRVGEQVQFLVTEPFLGKPTPRAEQLPGIYKGLEKLYLGAFKRWAQLLQRGATVVIVFPYVEMDRKVFSLETLIDKIAPFGYTMLHEPVLYHRPQAIVQRQIHFLRFQPN